MQLDDGFTLRVSAAVESTGWIHVQKGRRDRGFVGGWLLGFGQPRGGADAPWVYTGAWRQNGAAGKDFWGFAAPPSGNFLAPS